MPEDMSDRMPEDLPVTKRIVVMVGITRSKVILFFVWFSVSFGKKETRWQRTIEKATLQCLLVSLEVPDTSCSPKGCMLSPRFAQKNRK